ncbi:MAG: DNA topoisomerase I [Candidatus Nealsonbacteria bacterium RBG_13_36_15]|uniref:DNA topoisomerase 1 n=1 Tax=Candidatus Nealsonbacteria bacterium RBG_13_36_15 TaxID=1801660 RepID=A0A1G2DXE3_9BACT|nr:MAG: DNA topoisomerase I [Candidatus Nealsonbacteria bacterium RBG_13_36_15]
MYMQLVIVESPTKSKTIQQFLGRNYKVLSSYGHIRDLPADELGIDIKNDFKPKYIVIPRIKKIIQTLKQEAKKAKSVILATDEDREGESIAWHLIQVLNLNGKKPYQRIVFHEITKKAIGEALKKPRKVNINLVDAQQARRVLDRIVGYKLSPFLWQKVARGLSAGRVQSVTVKLVVDRERDIENFVPQEYWNIEALLEKQEAQNKGQKIEFTAFLIKKDGKIVPKLGIKTKKEADKIVNDLNGAEYKVIDIDQKETKRSPLPPFTTSTLQQESWKRFHFSAKFTMRIAQNLYERGFITYHRSDSLNLSDLSLFAAKEFLIKQYGKEYWAGFLKKYKTKGRAQEAHEAIRPTYPEKTPEKLKIQAKLDDNQFRLYDLIWRRFIACQMSQAVFDATAVNISAKNYTFRATGQVLKFDGFLKVYPAKMEERNLPSLKNNEILELIKLTPSQHFTQPPSRYTEATLIKTLEEKGIGRPSTYAPILATIQDRNYAEKDENRKFKPTRIGLIVNDLLVENFSQIVNVSFTAEMEENLDKIAQAKTKWVSTIEKFYLPFNENLKNKRREVSKNNLIAKETNEVCPDCGAKLLIRISRFGEFYACSSFPKCRYKKHIPKSLNVKCPKCKEGEIVERRTKNKKIFYGCSLWPDCDFASWEKLIGKNCPKCGSPFIITKWKKVRCSNKDCEQYAKHSE